MLAQPESRPAVSGTPWYRLLDLVFVAAMLALTLGVANEFFRPFHPWSPWTGTVSLTVIAVLWVRSRSSRARPAVIIGFGLCAFVLPVLSHLGSTALPMVILGTAVITVRVGWREALWTTGGHGLVLLAVGLTGGALGQALLELPAIGLIAAAAIGFGLALRDLEDSRHAAAHLAAELESSNRRLRATMTMQRDLVFAQERSRAAQDMHDVLGSRMTVVGMSLRFALRMRSADEEAAWAEVASAAATNAEALAEMRRWVRALHPPELIPAVGGAGAFDAIAESFRGTGMDVRVSHRGDTAPLTGEVSILAVRMVQECLTNTLRHSRSTHVSIALEQTAHQVRIIIEDDGRGSGPDDPAPATGDAGNAPPALPVTEGFGLRSLRERARALGGDLSAVRAPGGFRVTATCPLTEEE